MEQNSELEQALQVRHNQHSWKSGIRCFRQNMCIYYTIYTYHIIYIYIHMYILYIHQGLLQCIFQRIYQRLASCYVASCEEFSEICSSCVVTLLGVCGIRCSSAHDGIELAFCQSGTTCHDLNKGHSTRIGPRWKKLAVKSLEVSSGAA